MEDIENRVVRIAEALLAKRQYVTPIDVLMGLGWLSAANVDRWTRGRVTSLELCIGVDQATTTAAVDALRNWAQGHGLAAWETDYRDLRFTTAGDSAAEDAFRTRWSVIPGPAPDPLPARSRELTVTAVDTAWECTSCGEGGELFVKAGTDALCLYCADLGHLVFLPSGDAALSRRAKKLSRLSAVVVHMNTRRMRFERQGILVDNGALEQAARQCLGDAKARDRDHVRRPGVDAGFRADFAAAIREQFPGCPPGRADSIAYHAAVRGGSRIGRRSAAARALDSETIRLAVSASVRHVDTDYDELLMSGVGRDDARRRVCGRVYQILDTWRDGATVLDA